MAKKTYATILDATAALNTDPLGVAASAMNNRLRLTHKLAKLQAAIAETQSELTAWCDISTKANV